jgi:hypothetical protein
LAISSSESEYGTTSSARLCRMTVFGITALAVPDLFHAGQSSTSRGVAAGEVHADGLR